MPQYIECTFTPKEGGAGFTVRNIESVSWGVSRGVGPNGRIGMRGHDIHNISIVRHKSLHVDGVPQIESETIALSGAIEKKAYFSGEITLALADDSGNKIQTIRWDDGWICDFTNHVLDSGIQETMQVVVTGLRVDDTEFKRAV